MTDEIESGALPHDEIERIERRLEDLADDLERCRKLAILAKALVTGGAVWLAAAMFGIAGFGTPAAMASLAAVLAGLILGGSNRSTMQQTLASIDAAEARRNDLIGAIDLRTVRAQAGARDGAPVRWLH